MAKSLNSLTKILGVVFLVTTGVNASTYSDVWSEVKSNPYSSLPQYQTTLASMTRAGVNLIFKDATRTLNDRNDLLPRFQKLVHPIGICFSGTWTIDEANPYSGYYAEGKQGLIIVRASEAMGLGEAGNWRAFGIAGKIYPTDDASDNKDYQTANFFTVDDLGGTDTKSFLNLDKSNEPPISLHFSTIFSIGLVTKISKAFNKADSNAGKRPLYQISELGLSNANEAVTPDRMILRSEGNVSKVKLAKDFRNELRLDNFKGNRLKFGIYVAAKGETELNKIGQIVLDDEALSDSCDHRLHFSHPKFR